MIYHRIQGKAHRSLVYIAMLMVLLPTMVACSVAKQSQFNPQSIILGTSKEVIVAKFGNPYKTGFHKDINQLTCEDWYYKENLYIKKWYEVTTILSFQDGRLVSMEPGKETPLYREGYIIKN